MEPTYHACILTIPADFERTYVSLPRTVQNLAPRRVVFIGSRKVQELIDRSDIRDQVDFFDEEELIPFADVHKVMMDILRVEELPRGVTGWYYQQFLKMQYAYVCPDAYYLVWDGDTVPCKPFSMFQEDGTPVLDLKQEYCEEYFHTIEILFPGMRKCIDKSFISEHMLIRCDIMRQLVEEIMANPALTGETFYERILRAIRPGQLLNTAFSEFETYGTYVSFRHPGAYRLRNWHSFRLGGQFLHSERMTDEDYEWFGRDFDAISYEKDQTVREDHEEIFMSPRYREKLSARQILELAQMEYQEGYKEVWDEDIPEIQKSGVLTDSAVTDAILEASACEASGDREGLFRAIQKGLELDYRNYELFYMLGYYYLQDHIDQAYLCFQNALFYCHEEEDRAVIAADMEKLAESGQVTVQKTAIVIVSYNSCYLMQKNIESIRQTLPEGEYKIVVVDNASDDGVFQWLQEQKDILLVRNEQNVGFAPACNQGVKAIREIPGGADYDIFLLNNDTRLAPNALFWLRMGLYDGEKIGAAGACANYAGNDQQIEVEFPLPADYLEYGARRNVPMQDPREERVRLSGFAMLIRGNVWDAVGGMDEEFAPGYFEDDDLSMKIAKAGYRLLFCKNSFLYHAGSQSFAGKPGLEELLQDHYRLFIQKYGFAILEYADPDRELVSAIPYEERDEFTVLQIGVGLGADLKCVRSAYPNAHTVGVETRECLYEIVRKTETVFPGISALAGALESPVFQVLLIDMEEYERLSDDERELLERICVPDCVVLSQSSEEEGADFTDIKLVIWDLDNTFWNGILSEGRIGRIEENVTLVKTLTDCGIVNSISSKNDEQEARQVLREWGVEQYFVFPDINWENKGEQIRKKIADMHLRAENVLFLDDDGKNLEEARFYSPEIRTGLPEVIPELARYAAGLDRMDAAHRRLKNYQLLEEKREVQERFSDKEQFLTYSEIVLAVESDCLRESGRIAELVARTNQLNYTKVRDDQATLTEYLADETIRKGCIRVRDRFGDYGIVGFFCFEPGNQTLRHFLFSCRVMGMGIEQCVYRLLGCPELEVREPVAVRLEKEAETPWIRVCAEEVSRESSNQDRPDNRIRILLKGPCDMDSIAPYLSGGNITAEFNFVNDQGFITTGQNHSMHLWESVMLSEEELDEILRDVPFILREDFETSLFTKEYDVVCYSLLPDCHAGLYQNRRTGNYISFGSRNFDLTATENRRGYIDGSIVNHAFPFTEEIIERFAEDWRFVGSTAEEDILRNLDYIYTHMKGEPMLVLLLGSEIEYEGVNEEFANHAQLHQAVNARVKAYAADKSRIRIIETTDFIKSQDDYEDSINHFSRNVYYDLATTLCAFINERVAELAGKRNT